MVEKTEITLGDIESGQRFKFKDDIKRGFLGGHVKTNDTMPKGMFGVLCDDRLTWAHESMPVELIESQKEETHEKT